MRNIPWLATVWLATACFAACTAQAAPAGGSSSAVPASTAPSSAGGVHAPAGGMGHFGMSRVMSAGSRVGGPTAVTRLTVAGRAAAVATFKVPEPLTAADRKRIQESGYTAYDVPGQTYYCRDEIDPATRTMHCFTVLSSPRR